MRSILVLAVLALSGCFAKDEDGRLVRTSKVVDADYGAYIEANARAQQQQAAQLASIADASACNGDAACVISVKAIAGLTMQGAGNHSQVAPPPRKVHWSEAFRNVTAGVHPLGSIWAMVEGGKNNVRIAEIGAERDARRDEAWAGMTVGIADAFGSQEPAYSYTIGGDYVPGQIGDNAGRDQISGSQHLGDWRTGDNIARDTIGRDRTDYGSGNRIDSAGPFEEGPRCIGIGCQTINPPPEPEEGE